MSAEKYFLSQGDRLRLREKRLDSSWEAKAAPHLNAGRLAAVDVYRGSQGVPLAVPFRIFTVQFLSGKRPKQVKSYLNWVGTSSVFLYEVPQNTEPYSVFLLWHELGHLSRGGTVYHVFRYWLPVNVAFSMIVIGCAVPRNWVFVVTSLYVAIQLWWYVIWGITQEEAAADAFALYMLNGTGYFETTVEQRLEVLSADEAHAATLWRRCQIGYQHKLFRRSLAALRKRGIPLYLSKFPGLQDWLFLAVSVVVGWQANSVGWGLIWTLFGGVIVAFLTSTFYFAKARSAESRAEAVLARSIIREEFDVLNLGWRGRDAAPTEVGRQPG